MNETFGKALKELRESKGLSQQQLAGRLFVNRSSISNWESGRRIPDLIIISRLAQALDTDISELVNASEMSVAPPEVIIVDDETVLLAGAIPVLSEVMPQATITGFLKASEALDYARKFQISIAFLDIEIGKTSGLDLCQKILDINPCTNVIFLTSYPDYALKAWKTSASGFLTKPLCVDDIKEQLGKLRYPVRGL